VYLPVELHQVLPDLQAYLQVVPLKDHLQQRMIKEPAILESTNVPMGRVYRDPTSAIMKTTAAISVTKLVARAMSLSFAAMVQFRVYRIHGNVMG
jgi:hypothetical protein